MAESRDHSDNLGLQNRGSIIRGHQTDNNTEATGLLPAPGMVLFDRAAVEP
ncbi:hypothetical protein JOB18_029062 [Solea senegalensis]|uniref:Uncharacterized protein n=1 Tax=Solea senegalensis TaxID=28829 RepID=A0AAV6RTS0_SOLSE|nr:hypothetical protein JOB18_029062 [Solea senegalensis]